MSRYKGRLFSACYSCHRQKVKCSGEYPCSKCRSSKKECFFPSRDPALTVPESYLRKLENEVVLLRQSLSSAQRVTKEKKREISEEGSNSRRTNVTDRLIEDSTTEYFIRKLKGVYCGQMPVNPPENTMSSTSNTNLSGSLRGSDEQPALKSYTYVTLDHDNAETGVFVKLPSHSYALYQLGQFESFIGSDYHWYRKQRFREKMEAAYRTSHPQAVDRGWLCCFSVVLALAESYNDSTSPSFLLSDGIRINNDSQKSGQALLPVAPPGIELFKQALLLLKLSYEEPTIEQVEALNLISFYSYSLNRRKTAYAYAGMAHRLATILSLSNLPDVSIEPAELEHRKRVRWTAVCMELMACTELSLRPTYGLDVDRSLEFPENTRLSAEDMGDFSEPQYLTAQVKLCRIKCCVTEIICELRSGSLDEAYELINPCLQSLSQWREEFRLLSLSFCETGRFSPSTLAHPSMRTIASLIMRYNQCYILLLRPLLLKELYSLVREENASVSNNELTRLNNECLRAATENASIQSALSQCHRLAKFGFWESLHMFSSLTILVISSFVAEKCPAAFSSNIDRELYQTVRDLLGEMARLGNSASRDHDRMIEDVEKLFPTGNAYTGTAGGIEDLIEWPDYLEFDDIGFTSINQCPPLLG